MTADSHDFFDDPEVSKFQKQHHNHTSSLLFSSPPSFAASALIITINNAKDTKMIEIQDLIRELSFEHSESDDEESSLIWTTMNHLPSDKANKNARVLVPTQEEAQLPSTTSRTRRRRTIRFQEEVQVELIPTKTTQDIQDSYLSHSDYQCISLENGASIWRYRCQRPLQEDDCFRGLEDSIIPYLLERKDQERARVKATIFKEQALQRSAIPFFSSSPDDNQEVLRRCSESVSRYSVQRALHSAKQDRAEVLLLQDLDEVSTNNQEYDDNVSEHDTTLPKITIHPPCCSSPSGVADV